MKKKKHLINKQLVDESFREISDWKEYSAFNEHLQLFSSISANEALNNALQLATLVNELKLKKLPKDLNTPSFKTRLNVLENEILRLKDMTFIPTITAGEVNQQVTKIFEAFSATNAKINTVYLKLRIDQEIENPSELSVQKDIDLPLKKEEPTLKESLEIKKN